MQGPKDLWRGAAFEKRLGCQLLGGHDFRRRCLAPRQQVLRGFHLLKLLNLVSLGPTSSASPLELCLVAVALLALACWLLRPLLLGLVEAVIIAYQALIEGFFVTCLALVAVEKELYKMHQLGGTGSLPLSRGCAGVESG